MAEKYLCARSRGELQNQVRIGGFSRAGPTARNSLPHHLHQISDTGLFKRRIKTELFRTAYVASSC